MLLQLYEHSLKLYPETYQRHYAKEMLQTMTDIVADNPSGIHKTAIVLKEIIVTPLNALEQYVIIFSRHRHVAPKTIVSLAALALLIPFFAALVADEITEFLTGGHLYNTWLWSRPALLVWIVILPVISLVVSLSVYIISVARRWQRERKLFLLAKQYWLTIVTGLLCVGILLIVVFHDSAHCWVGTKPIAVVVSCTESGILGGDQH